MDATAIHGVDFTSAPRAAKPITVATLARVDAGTYALASLDAQAGWPAFDAFLRRPGPWIAGFDLPFGLPRELVASLGWPDTWDALMTHYGSLERAHIRATFKAWCDARPAGGKFAHRRTDGPAGSSPSMRWVNPPVAWMLHAGVPRLIAAGVCMPGLSEDACRDHSRIALEAYPGFLARSITRASYKSDARAQDTPARRDARMRIVDAIERGAHPLGGKLAVDAAGRAALVTESSADRLDAVLCALQAAWAFERHRDGHPRYGLPDDIDPLEGWIVGVPSGPAPA